MDDTFSPGASSAGTATADGNSFKCISISASLEGTWALGSNGDIYHAPPGSDDLTVTSSLPDATQISAGGKDNVALLAAGGVVYRLDDGTVTNLGAPYGLISATQDGSIWGVSGSTVKVWDPKSDVWNPIVAPPQQLAQIAAVSATEAWGFGASSILHFSDGAWVGWVPWLPNILDITAGTDGSVIAVDNAGAVHVLIDAQWCPAGGTLAAVSAASMAEVWGVSLDTGYPARVSGSVPEGENPHAWVERPGVPAPRWDAQDPFDETKSTHLWIVNRGAELAHADAEVGEAIRDLVAPFRGRTGVPFHDNVCIGLYETDYKYNNGHTWCGHFYDPVTQKNWLGMHRPTALTEGVVRFAESVQAYNEGVMDEAGYKLGMALHYLTDLTQPMHASNFTFLSSFLWGYHSAFESYMMKLQSTLNPNVTYTAATSINPGDYLIAAAQKSQTYWNNYLKTSARLYPGHLRMTQRAAIADAVQAGMISDAILVTAQFLVAWGRVVGLHASAGGRWRVASTGQDAGQQLVQLPTLSTTAQTTAGNPGITVYAPSGNGFRQSWTRSDADTSPTADTWLVVDREGDGRSDLVRIWNDGGKVAMEVYSPTLDGGYEVAFTGSSMGTYRAGSQWMAVDRDGNGKDEIVASWYSGGAVGVADFVPSGSGYQAGAVNESVETGAGNDLGSVLVVNPPGGGSAGEQLARLFGGAGGVLTYSIYVYDPSKPNWVKAANLGGTLVQQAGKKQLFTVDRDGDGRTQIIQTWTNGSGLALALYSPSTSGYAMTFVNTNFFMPAVKPTDPGTFLPVDFDGDGRTHLLQAWALGANCSMTLYSPDAAGGFTQTWENTDLPMPTAPTGATDKWVVADRDSDGRSEVIQLRANGSSLSMAVYSPKDGGYEQSFYDDDL